MSIIYLLAIYLFIIMPSDLILRSKDIYVKAI